MLLRFFTLLVLILFATPLLADQCLDWTQKAHTAYTKADKVRLSALHQKIQKSNCSAKDKHYISLSLSRILYEEVKDYDTQIDRLNSDLNASQTAKKQTKYRNALSTLQQQRIDALIAILDIETTFWPALLDLGLYYDKQKEFALAHEYYNRTLSAINNVHHTPEELLPDYTVIQSIYAKADSSLAATESYLALFQDQSKTRSIGKTRRIKPTSRNIPIHFDSGKSSLVGTDKQYVLDLYNKLSQKKFPDIHLIGHTDPIGGINMNLKLSKKRANTVKKFFKQKGYSGKITVTGEGENRPLKTPYADPIAHYGKSKWHRMLRRVEIKTN